MEAPKLLKVASILVAAIFLANTASNLYVYSQEPPASPWLSSASPNLDKIRDFSQTESYPERIGSNRDCYRQKLITRPRFLNYSEQIHDTCVVDTAFGSSDQSYLLRPGTEVAGPIKYNDTNFNIIPIPHSSTALNLFSGPVYGSYGRLVRGFDNGLDTATFSDGKVVHNVTLPSDAVYGGDIKDRAGNRQALSYDSISFSANGRWMVADVPMRGAIRVNVSTGEVLPFGPAFKYNIGAHVGLNTAITSDGRYAVISSKDFGVFRMYDLSTCGEVPNHITQAVSCQFTNLWTFMTTQVEGFTYVGRFAFRDNYTLDLYAAGQINGINMRSQYMMVADGKEAAGFQYLALGDSFSSGEGAYQYKAVTDVPENKCHISQRSYPYLISDTLGLNSYDSVACSGAILNDVNSEDKNYDQELSQSKGKAEQQYNEEIYNGFLPGYRTQISFVNKYKPSVITMSAVGNDIGFAGKIMRCLEPDTCYATYEDRVEVVREINAQFDRMVRVYQDVKAAGDPRAKIYVVGYPQLTYPGGNCALNVHLNNDELIFAQQLVDYLNTVIKAATERAGVFYVDVQDAFQGHRFCETDSWNMAVNGLTAGNDTFKVIGAESYHPNTLGHQLYKQAIIARTSSFTTPMPLPNAAAFVPNEADLDILNVPSTGRQIYRTNYDTNPDNNTAVRGGAWGTVIKSGKLSLKANSVVRAYILSEPKHLADIPLDARGEANIQITIPADTKPGFHTIHLYATSATGQPVNIYKPIYVAASTEDYDGDGVSNNLDPCPATTQSGIDVDGDGIDDACDDLIDKPAKLPEVSFSWPLDGMTLAGGEPIWVKATHEDGIESVKLQLNGQEYTTLTHYPYGIGFSTGMYPNGEHTLTAIATTKTGLQASASVTFKINNDPNFRPHKEISKPLQILIDLQKPHLRTVARIITDKLWPGDYWLWYAERPY